MLQVYGFISGYMILWEILNRDEILREIISGITQRLRMQTLCDSVLCPVIASDMPHDTQRIAEEFWQELFRLP